MPPQAQTLLFIASNDCGELAACIYAASGQPFNSVLALPPRLHSLHHRGVGYPCSPYVSVDDLLALADVHRPGIVFLFSGYLFGINGLFGPADLLRLVDGLRARGCRVVTSDPFLGLARNPVASLFPGPTDRGIWLTDHFNRLTGVIQNIVHLYPADVPASDKISVRSFFNRHILSTPQTDAAALEKLSELPSIRPESRRWLFVLAAEDYHLQLQRHGRRQFHEILLRKLAETTRAGRQPVVVAPQVCIDALAAAPSAEGAIMLPFCAYDLFSALANEAEITFYWNIFSNSILTRAVNEKPVGFFDAGHLARSVPALDDLGRQTYYANAEMPHFNQLQELTVKSIEAAAATQRQSLSVAVAKLKALPDIGTVFEGLLA